MFVVNTLKPLVRMIKNIIKTIIIKCNPVGLFFSATHSFSESRNAFFHQLTLLFTSFKQKLLLLTGRSWEDFLDALFLSSFSLVLIKGVYICLFFQLIPSQVNLLIYFLSFLLGMFFPFLITEIRESFIVLLKALIGRKYWLDLPDGATAGEPELEELFLLIDIRDTTLINKVFQSFFIFLVQIRLYILQEPYLFVILNFLITYFLITNNLFLFSTLLSLLLLLSRLTLYATDKNNKDFLRGINCLEPLKEDECIEPTWKNAELVFLWIIRSFSDRELYNLEEKRYKKELIEDGEEDANMFFHDWYIKRIYWYKYSQLYRYRHKEIQMGAYLPARKRKAIAKDKREERIEIIRKGKKNNVFSGRFLLAVVPFGNWDFWARLCPTRVKKVLKRIMTFSSAQEENHPQLISVQDKFLCRTNLSTQLPSSRVYPYFGKLPFGNSSSTILQKVKIQKLTKEELTEINKEIQTRTIELIKTPKDYIGYPQSNDIELYLPKGSFLYKFKKEQDESSFIIQSDFALLSSCCFNKDISKDVAIKAINCVIDYHFLMAKGLQNRNEDQSDFHIETYNFLKKVRNEINSSECPIPFSSSAIMDSYINEKIENLQHLNNELYEHPDEDPIWLNILFNAKYHQLTFEDGTKRHMSNSSLYPGREDRLDPFDRPKVSSRAITWVDEQD